MVTAARVRLKSQEKDEQASAAADNDKEKNWEPSHRKYKKDSAKQVRPAWFGNTLGRAAHKMHLGDGGNGHPNLTPRAQGPLRNSARPRPSPCPSAPTTSPSAVLHTERGEESILQLEDSHRT